MARALFLKVTNRILVMLSQSKSRLINRVLRNFNTSSWVCASHYDVLGITSKATQSDIKTAYYELSKVYHPDKSPDEESAKKFRAIAEAYEVLGNVNLKKMYDKGLIVGQENSTRMDYHPEPEPTDPTLRFYKSRQRRQVTPTMDGRTPIYDFDSWSRNHYGDLFKKSQYDKEFIKVKRAKAAATRENNRQETLMYMIVCIGSLFIMFVINGTSDYDRVKTKHTKQQESVTTEK